MPGKLYLIPNVIADGTQEAVITPQIRDSLAKLEYFLAEDVRTARRYFSNLRIYDSIEALKFFVLNKDTRREELHDLMKPLLDGFDMGVVSESGCPGIADPGALAVAFAHAHDIEVIPLVGPSSIILALMSSGLNGQQFAFHGYLPIDEKDASKSLKSLEQESKTKRQTQIFIETPYRNMKLLKYLTDYLHPDTQLCVAVDLTAKHQTIISKPVVHWKKVKVELPKAPAVFLFLA